MIQASIIGGRRTYTTPLTTPPANAGLPAAIIPAGALGFEFVARIATESGMLPYISIALHETAPSGLFVLLLDQTKSSGPNALNLDPPPAALNGDFALVTLGPIFQGLDDNGAPIGATMVYSESVTEAEAESRDTGGRVHRIAGFPFDAGCIAVLSTTPGRLTYPVGLVEPVQGGMRVTARWQKCG